MYRVTLLGVCLLITSAALAVGMVADTVHNLSVSGPGLIKSQTEDRICIYCHIPHSSTADAPLWNRLSAGGPITSYQSSTSDASPGSVSSASLNCLSCHDGTIALGDLANSRTDIIDNLSTTKLTGRSGLGTDLSDDHPVSITYDAGLSSVDPDLVHPTAVDLPLNNGELHCTSCHDSHDNTIPPFLHKSTLNGELCITCHFPSGSNPWSTSSHATSVAAPQSTDPWPERKSEWKGQTVAENACMNCHTPHNATTPTRLVKDLEEQTCYRCHDGTVGANNIQADFQKFSRHPVDVTPNINHDHTAVENPTTMPLHVECQDCHNPHESFSSSPMISFNPSNPQDTNLTVAPFANGSLAGVKGIDISGSVIAESQNEYEVCFKCHGVPGNGACDNGRCSTAAGYEMVRQDGVYNLRDKFDTGNPALVSYHPIYANNTSNNSEVPSLRNDIPLDKISSQIYCSDCHSSNDSPAGGGTGSGGPHGSTYEGLMAQRYGFDPRSSSTTFDNELCFKCHDSNNLDVSFNKHSKHLGKFSCISCHDPHGSSKFPHLLNFLTSANVAGTFYSITGSGSYTEPTWIDDGTYQGTCWMDCHGKNHRGWSY